MSDQRKRTDANRAEARIGWRPGNRELEYDSNLGNFDSEDTVMLRAGFTF